MEINNAALAAMQAAHKTNKALHAKIGKMKDALDGARRFIRAVEVTSGNLAVEMACREHIAEIDAAIAFKTEGGEK